MRTFFWILLISFSLNSFLFAQKIINVNLDTLSFTDQVSAAVASFKDVRSISPITSEYLIPDSLIEPDGAKKYKYFTLYTPEGDRFIDIMVKTAPHGDSLYIDLDNDNDLRNDGGPYFFSANENEFLISPQLQSGTSLKSIRALHRAPHFVLTNDSLFNHFVEENFTPDGSLKPELVNYWSRHHPEFNGQKGTFYYISRKNIIRGTGYFDDKELLLGIWDYNLNGQFSDPKDKLIIDLNADNRLTYRNRSEVFSISDTTAIGHKNYLLKSVSADGANLEFTEVFNNPVRRFLFQPLEVDNQSLSDVYFAELNPDFWDKKFLTIAGEKVIFEDLKNSVILLNFWGEWRKPCYKEIPVLTKLYENHSDELKIISFLYTGNLGKARQVIQDENLNWEHILVTPEITEWFNIGGYPQNFLIFSPDEPLSILVE